MPQYPDSRNVLQPDCARCPHLAETRECISWGTGPLDASILVVGEAPGAGTPEADRWKGGNWTGMAYTARHSGRLIRELMADAGYGPESCYYTNAVKCFPPDGEGSNREPTAEELTNCRTHLRTEIEGVAPDVIVPTGKHATETLFALSGRSLDGFIDRVLESIDSEALSVPLVPVLHPSYQNIWIARLGYDYGEYAAELGERLDTIVGEPSLSRP